MKLSIITINKNNAVGLEKTIKSVLSQSYHDFEYIVVDGHSSDNSILIENTYRKNLFSLSSYHYISEEDTGIYQAMNKGISLSQGEYLLFLNSGDYLCNEEVLNNIIPLLDGTDIIQGNIIEYGNGKEKVNTGYGRSDISFIDVYYGNFLHQASFIKKTLFEIYGFYDESYKIIGDTYFFAKSLGFGNASFKYIDLCISYYDVNGISSDKDINFSKIKNKEYNRYIHETYSDRLIDFIELSMNSTKLYSSLHKIKAIWIITLLLNKISQLKIKK